MSQMDVAPKDARNSYRLLSLFLVLNVAFQLISDVTAGKIIAIAGIGVSVTVLYFPFTYILSDVLTEVYGYARARQVVWLTLLASVLAGITYQIAAIVPPAPFFQQNDAYVTVFQTVPRILVGGWLAVFAGEISNNYVLAKMKVWFEGRFLWARLIFSTIVGQGINTLVFYVVALYGILPVEVLVPAILMGWAIKVMVEILMSPITYVVVGKVKRIEGVDFFDRETDFNPFSVQDR